MQTRDLMTKKPLSIQPTTTVGEALDLMSEADIRHLPVVDDGQLVGMISDRDMRHISWGSLFDEGAARRFSAPVSSLMTGTVLRVGAESDVSEAVELMIEEKVGAVPVVDEGDGTLEGIISYVDVLKHAVDRL